MTNRYSVNYSDQENADVVEAARIEGDAYVGRWIGNAALDRARQIIATKGGRRG